MRNILEFASFKKSKASVLMLLWLLLWIIPWADWLSSNWLRLALTLLVFAFPGTIFSLLLQKKQDSLVFHVLTGFTLSVFFVAFASFAGRILSFPFSWIKFFFILFGFGGIYLLRRTHRLESTSVNFQSFPWFAVLVILALIYLRETFIVFEKFGGDDMSYLAVLTNAQHANPLSFKETFFNTDGLEKIRFWMAMQPFVLAFISQLSQIHGILLLGYYIESFFASISVVSLFFLNKAFLGSYNKSAVAVLLQFAFFLMLTSGQQSGNIFFYRLSEDKAFASFILAPVFFVLFRQFLHDFSVQHGILTLLSGWAIAFTHPVILFFVLFIAGGYAFFALAAQREYKKFIWTAGLILLIVVLVAPLRFADTPGMPTGFDLENALEKVNITRTRISYIEGTPFYGFHPERIQILPYALKKNILDEFFSWSFLWLVIFSFLWSLVNLKKKDFAPFLAAVSLLLLVCLVPYTGWLVGKFVTARMLWRSPWLVPIGMMGVILLDTLSDFVQKKTRFSSAHRGETFSVWVVFLVGLSIIWHFGFNVYRFSSYPTQVSAQYLTKLVRLAKTGEYLEKNISQPARFVANGSIMKYLPGLSSKSDVALFRTETYSRGYIKNPISLKEIYLVLSVNESISLSRRIQILRNYQIQYILDERPELKNIYLSRPEWFSAQKIEGYWLIEFRQPAQ